HAALGEREGLLGQVRKEREREEAVRDGAAEGRALGARGIDMDPLEVLDRLGEGVDALLRDLDPRRDADFLADTRLEAADSGHFRAGFAGLDCAAKPWRIRSSIGADSALRRSAPA